MPPSLEEEGIYHSDTIIVKGDFTWPSQSLSSPSMSSEVASLLAQINNQDTTNVRHNAPPALESPEPLQEDVQAPSLPAESTIPPDNYSNFSRSKGSLRGATMEDRLLMMPEKRPLPWREGVEAGADNETGGESRRKQIRFGCLLATRGEVQDAPCQSCANGRGKFSLCVALEGFFKGACASCQLSGRPNRCSIKVNDDDTTVPAEVSSSSNAQYQLQSQGPSPKRRKTDTVPEWESARPQWDHELGDSHARHQQMNIEQRPWATVNSPAMSTQPAAQGMNGSTLTPQTNWATVNQPTSVPANHKYNHVRESNGGSYQSNVEVVREEGTVTEDSSVALIDTLPKNKQRQVYGLVSGLQGGIDHLQRELDSLKRALGIDDED